MQRRNSSTATGDSDLSIPEQHLRDLMDDPATGAASATLNDRDMLPPLSFSDYSASSNDISTPSTSRHNSPSTKWMQSPLSVSSSKHHHGVLPDLKLTAAGLPLDYTHHRSYTAASSSIASSTPSTDIDDDEVVEPHNFAEVASGLFRSSFPRRQHFAFIRSLGLKTVLNFTQDEYPAENLEFLEEEGITFMSICMPGNKEETIHVPPSSIEDAIRIILNPNNYPLLMHCNKGRHRTGCVVGVLRKLQNWPIEAILEEYRQYSFPKSRAIDQTCISQFDILPVWETVKNTPKPTFIPLILDTSSSEVRSHQETSSCTIRTEKAETALIVAS